mmetsp:Transcript_15460/g.39889  ORF Transcript_15460/g.39889 Transcript_15460/m.39889 type:complete len:392 (+) Transcript_15460:102-1277(+)
MSLREIEIPYTCHFQFHTLPRHCHITGSHGHCHATTCTSASSLDVGVLTVAVVMLFSPLVYAQGKSWQSRVTLSACHSPIAPCGCHNTNRQRRCSLQEWPPATAEVDLYEPNDHVSAFTRACASVAAAWSPIRRRLTSGRTKGASSLFSSALTTGSNVTFRGRGSACCSSVAVGGCPASVRWQGCACDGVGPSSTSRSFLRCLSAFLRRCWVASASRSTTWRRPSAVVHSTRSRRSFRVEAEGARCVLTSRGEAPDVEAPKRRSIHACTPIAASTGCARSAWSKLLSAMSSGEQSRGVSVHSACRKMARAESSKPPGLSNGSLRPSEVSVSCKSCISPVRIRNGDRVNSWKRSTSSRRSSSCMRAEGEILFLLRLTRVSSSTRSSSTFPAR